MSLPTLDFILARAVATRAAQDSLKATWTWEEKTLQAWDADIAALRLARENDTKAETALVERRAEFHAATDELHRDTMQALALLKVRYRNEPAKSAVVANLRAEGDSRTAILNEAEAVAAAWAELDATFAPTPDNTLAAFNALRADCQAQRDMAARARTEERRFGGEAAERAAHLHDATIAWYAAATRIFPEGTPQGGLIRSTVPTTYQKPADTNTTPPPPAP